MVNDKVQRCVHVQEKLNTAVFQHRIASICSGSVGDAMLKGTIVGAVIPLQQCYSYYLSEAERDVVDDSDADAGGRFTRLLRYFGWKKDKRLHYSVGVFL